MEIFVEITKTTGDSTRNGIILLLFMVYKIMFYLLEMGLVTDSDNNIIWVSVFTKISCIKHILHLLSSQHYQMIVDQIKN